MWYHVISRDKISISMSLLVKAHIKRNKTWLVSKWLKGNEKENVHETNCNKEETDSNSDSDSFRTVGKLCFLVHGCGRKAFEQFISLLFFLYSVVHGTTLCNTIMSRLPPITSTSPHSDSKTATTMSSSTVSWPCVAIVTRNRAVPRDAREVPEEGDDHWRRTWVPTSTLDLCTFRIGGKGRQVWSTTTIFLFPLYVALVTASLYWVKLLCYGR